MCIKEGGRQAGTLGARLEAPTGTTLKVCLLKPAPSSIELDRVLWGLEKLPEKPSKKLAVTLRGKQPKQSEAYHMQRQKGG